MSEAVPRVLVLMAAYNGAAHIEDQIRSILDQRDVDVRLLVRDDGSTDATPSLVAQVAARHPGRIELATDAVGPTGSAATNFGVLLRACTIEAGEWIALADQDDVWFPDKLACAVERMRAEHADGYSSNLIAFDDGANAAWQVRKDGSQRPFDYLFQGASAGCTYVLSSRALDTVRAGIERIGGTIPKRASHDWLIYALCRSANLWWTLDPRARIAYRQHATNVYGTKSGLARMRERAGMLRARWYRENVLWLRSAVVPSPDERRVFARVERMTVRDRWWLARRARDFRRDPQDARQLALAFLTGLF